jgi:hypothetical protein
LTTYIYIFSFAAAAVVVAVVAAGWGGSKYAPRNYASIVLKCSGINIA